MKEAAERYIAHCRVDEARGALERSTVNYYDGLIRRHVLDPEIGVGQVKLGKLSRGSVNAFRDRLLKDRSEYLTRRVLGVLSLVVQHAIDNDLGIHALIGIQYDHPAGSCNRTFLSITPRIGQSPRSGFHTTTHGYPQWGLRQRPRAQNQRQHPKRLPHSDTYSRVGTG